MPKAGVSLAGKLSTSPPTAVTRKATVMHTATTSWVVGLFVVPPDGRR